MVSSLGVGETGGSSSRLLVMPIPRPRALFKKEEKEVIYHKCYEKKKNFG